MAKAKVIYVRYGFSDQVMKVTDSLKGDEVCSCNSYIVGYEDENGKECDETGRYLDGDPDQLKIQIDGYTGS